MTSVDFCKVLCALLGCKPRGSQVENLVPRSCRGKVAAPLHFRTSCPSGLLPHCPLYNSSLNSGHSSVPLGNSMTPQEAMHLISSGTTPWDQEVILYHRTRSPGERLTFQTLRRLHLVLRVPGDRWQEESGQSLREINRWCKTLRRQGCKFTAGPTTTPRTIFPAAGYPCTPPST